MGNEKYIWFDGEKINVSEEVYRAYYRPVWREAKQREVRDDMEYSLNALEDSGFEAVSDDKLIDEIVEDKLLLNMLVEALAELTDDERGLIDALFHEDKSERQIAAETGVPHPTIHSRKNAVIKKLKKWLEKKL